MKYEKMNNLFLRQSYLDSWEDYERSLKKKSFIKWDYIILTASNKAQATAYRNQIENRLEKGLLPEETTYAVLPDPEGKRVGSGGATFQVMRYIAEQEPERENPFKNRRILVIHSGGDSKRVPQYSAIGKLFSPVPRELPDGRSSTLFDEFIVGMSGVPSRIQEGMLVLSGDVLLLFNPLQIDLALTVNTVFLTIYSSIFKCTICLYNQITAFISNVISFCSDTFSSCFKTMRSINQLHFSSSVHWFIFRTNPNISADTGIHKHICP